MGPNTIIPPPPGYESDEEVSSIPPPPTDTPGQRALTQAPQTFNPRGGDDEYLSIPTINEAYSNMIKPVTEGVAAALRNLPMSTLTQAGMSLGPVKNAINWLSQGTVTGPPSEEQMRKGSQTAAEMVVPQTPVEAGAVVAAPFAGSLSRITGGPAARILTQMAGSGAGSVLSGNDTGTVIYDAGKGGTYALGGEVLSSLGSLGLKSAPNNPIIGGKRNIADMDAATYAEAMKRAAPDALNDYPIKFFGGAPNSSDLLDMANRGRRRIGDLKESTAQAISGMETGPNMPAYGQFGGTVVTGGGGTVRQAARASHETHFSNTLLDLPSIGERLTLEEANRRLSEIGARAYGKDPLARTFQGKDQRELYAELAQDMVREARGLNPQAADLFENVQGQVKKGYTLLKPIEGTATAPGPAWQTGRSDPQFNTAKLQDLVNSPRGMAMLTEKLGREEALRIANELRRGAPQGLKDELIEGAGGYLDPGMKVLRGQTNLGRGSLQQGLSFIGLSNIGSSYAGKRPYSMPGTPQSIMNLLMGQYGQE